MDKSLRNPSKSVRDSDQLEKDVKMIYELGDRFERQAKLAEINKKLQSRRMEKEPQE